MSDPNLLAMYRRHLEKTRPNRTEKLNHVLNVMRLGVWAGLTANKIVYDLHENGVPVFSDDALHADLRAAIAGMRQQARQERKVSHA